MTRKALAIVALFLGLVATQLTPVSADSGCTGLAREQCERVAATTSSAVSFSVVAPASVHWFTPGGVAQEHFEAMSVLAPESYRVSDADYHVPAPIVTTSDQQRFVEENTILPGTWTATYMEPFTSLPGQGR
jgi:hypothetical protein